MIARRAATSVAVAVAAACVLLTLEPAGLAAASPVCRRGLTTVERDPRGLLPLPAHPLRMAAAAALRSTNRRDRPQVVAAVLATADRARGDEAKYECGARVWRRTVVVYIRLRALLPSESLSQRVLFVGRFRNGYRVWQVVH